MFISLFLCNERKLVNLTFVTTMLSAELTGDVSAVFGFATMEVFASL